MFILIFEQLLKMFFIMVLAFVCYKIRLVDQNGNKTVSNLLLLIVNPILIITVYQTEYDPELVRGLLLSFAAAAATHILGIIISTLLIRPKAGADYCIERFNAMYSNCGFIVHGIQKYRRDLQLQEEQKHRDQCCNEHR